MWKGYKIILVQHHDWAVLKWLHDGPVYIESNPKQFMNNGAASSMNKTTHPQTALPQNSIITCLQRKETLCFYH